MQDASKMEMIWHSDEEYTIFEVRCGENGVTSTGDNRNYLSSFHLFMVIIIWIKKRFTEELDNKGFAALAHL